MGDTAEDYHLYSSILVAVVEAVAAAKDQSDADLHIQIVGIKLPRQFHPLPEMP